MNKTLPLLLTLFVQVSPVMAWGEGGCSFSKNNKASQDETVEKVDSSDAFDR